MSIRFRWLFGLLCLVTTSIPTVAQQPPDSEKMTSHASELLSRAANSSIFIYGSGVDPCAPSSPGTSLLPLGSAFVVGITDKSSSKPDSWHGWKFLVTAKHVVSNQSRVVIRLNLAREMKFKCQTLALEKAGQNQNVFLGAEGADIAAISLPDIPDTDPTVVEASLLIDAATMKKRGIGVGTQVFTVGYIFGYSGLQANFPVTKFGQISFVTNDSWFFNSASRLNEEGYVVQLPNAPGLSGAPIFTHGIEFDVNPFRFRQLQPYVVGVMKAMLLAPVNGGVPISQGLAVIEPASNLRAAIRQIAKRLNELGKDVDVD